MDKKDISVGKDSSWFAGPVPPGQTTNAINWWQKKVMVQAMKLPHDFATRAAWETFKADLRRKLPETIGIPQLPPLQPSTVRARFRISGGVICERVDIYMDDDYAMPAFLYLPENPPAEPMTGLVWSPGWPQTKYEHSCCELGVRGAQNGFAVLVLDHAPFGETTFMEHPIPANMTLVMTMGHLLGYSQLGVRSAENTRAGQYMRSRPDINPKRVILAGLCQGGMDTWLTAALDDGFCAAAPICSASTFAIHMAEMASYRANGDSSPFPFGILKVCDIEHLHACVAPRPLLIRANLPDEWWPVSGLDAIESFARKIYRLYDAEDNLDVATEVHEHAITGPFADALIQFVKNQRN
jgi:dienelactone hydrolase